MNTYKGNGTLLLNFTGRSGAARAVRAGDKRATTKTHRAALRALLIKEQHADYVGRASEFGNLDLSKGRSLISKAFGTTLRQYRKEIGYSQEELAQVVGLDRTYPSLLERGLRVPTIGIVVGLAFALKIKPIELWCAFLDRLRAETPRRSRPGAGPRRASPPAA